LKKLIFIVIFCIFAFNVSSQNLATFQFSLILNNLNIYKDYKLKLDEFKKTRVNELKIEEDLLFDKLQEIEDEKILLSEIEYLSNISNFNEEKKNFENKVNNFNNILNENISLNEKKILTEIVNIVKKIAVQNEIDVVFSDDQYFLASDTVDISGQIYNELNKIKIILEIPKNE